jgi:hypothetical protein
LTERKGAENDNEEKPKKKSHQCKIKDLERKKFFNGEMKAETFFKMEMSKKNGSNRIIPSFRKRSLPFCCRKWWLLSANGGYRPLPKSNLLDFNFVSVS